MKRHFKIRPPKDAHNIERWTGTEWIPDDGEPGLAFSGSAGRGYPAAWFPECRCFAEPNCPKRRAMDRTCERFRASNGCSVEDPNVIRRRQRAEAATRKKQRALRARRRDLVAKAKRSGLMVVGSVDGPRLTWKALQAWIEKAEVPNAG